MISKKTQRSFVLGDSWVYYKIYTGYKTADKVLSNIILPIVNQLIEEQCVNKWFFIRYKDPKYHIRVRFHYTKPDDLLIIINRLYPHFKIFINQNLIWNIQTDTYQREIERYGVNSMDLSEMIFYHDSMMIVKFLGIIENQENPEELRWLFSLRAIDSLLNNFKYTTKGKNDLLENLSSSFKNEFNASKFLRKQLSDKYRNKRKEIENFMAITEKNKPFNIKMLDILSEKEKNIDCIVTEILKLRNKNNLGIDLNYLLSSYIHMFMNRLFTSKNRLHEMVCYDFLFRYYKSKLARIKKQNLR